MASIPPPTAPLTTTATDSVGCHTRTNFALVGGRRDLKNLPETFTQNRPTILNLVVQYIIELDTIAGTITLGTFETIESARKYLAGSRGRICPIWPPATLAADLIESYSTDDLLKKLEKVTEKLQKKTPNSARPHTK